MGIKRSVPRLMDEPSINVYPSLAKMMGINKAVIFQQLHFLLNITEQSNNQYNQIDDEWWVYNSYEEWQTRYFPWLSEVTVKRLFLELEKDGLVLSRQSVKNPSDRRKWYRIDYQAWYQFDLTTVSKRYDGSSYQNDPMVVSKRYDGYSETPSETPSDKAAAATAAKIFTLFSDNVQLITPMIADDIKEALTTFPATWLEDAIKEAALNNAKSWKYVRVILKRWQKDGRYAPKPPSKSSAAAPDMKPPQPKKTVEFKPIEE